MANLIQNGGFEDDNDWTYRFSSERNTSSVYAGTYAADLGKDPLQLTAGQIQQDNLGLTTGAPLVLRLWVWPGGADDTLLIELDKGDGSFVTIATVDELPSGWRQVTVSTSALGTTGRIRITATNFNEVSGWHVDEIDMRVGVGTTNNFYEALKTDLETVTNLNVYGEPTDPMSAALPAAIVSQHEGGAEPDEISTLSGHAEQEFGVKLVVQSATPHETMQDLLDEVRNAIEPRGGTLNAAGTGVELAVVASWGEMVTSDDVHNLRAMIDGSVLIRYTYKLGQL